MPEFELCNLRPMIEADLDQVLVWRNSARIRKEMYTDHIITISEHRAWFERVNREKRSYHYVFEYDAKPGGVINVNRIDTTNMTCHWGFYIGVTELPRGSATVMGFMAIDEIFDVLQMRKIIGEAIVTNLESIKYHLRLGFTQEGIMREHVLRNDEPIDIVTFGLIEHEWEKVRPGLEQKFVSTTRVG